MRTYLPNGFKVDSWEINGLSEQGAFTKIIMNIYVTIRVRVPMKKTWVMRQRKWIKLCTKVEPVSPFMTYDWSFMNIRKMRCAIYNENKRYLSIDVWNDFDSTANCASERSRFFYAYVGIHFMLLNGSRNIVACKDANVCPLLGETETELFALAINDVISSLPLIEDNRFNILHSCRQNVFCFT